MIKDPKKRLDAVWALCKVKMVCTSTSAAQAGVGQGDVLLDNGCGARQPTVKKDGLKFLAVYKQVANDVRLFMIFPNLFS